MGLHLCVNFKAIEQLFIRKCSHELSIGVYLVIDNLVYVASDALPLYQINRTLGYGDITFQRFEDTDSLNTNAVVLVFGECQFSAETYLKGVSTLR